MPKGRPIPRRPLRARPCICHKHMFERENEGICVWCGHGLARVIREHAYARNMVRVDPELDRRLFALEGEQARRDAGQRGGRARPRWTREACVEAAREWEHIYGELPTTGDWVHGGDPRVDHPTYQTIYERFGGWPAFMREIADVPRERVAA